MLRSFHQRALKYNIYQIGQYVLLIFVALVLAPLIFSSKWTSSSDFHSCIEMSSSILAFIAGIITYVYYNARGNTFFLFVGIGFFISGSEDLIHGLFSFERIWEETAFNLQQFIPGTYVAGRISLALFCIAAVVLEQQLESRKRIVQMSSITIPISILFGFSFTYLATKIHLPDFIHPERLVSRPLDMFSAVLFFLAFVLSIKRFLRIKDSYTHYLLLCLLFNGLGQIYMSFSKDLYDIHFDVAHVANILSYAMPIMGITVYSLNALNESKKAEEEIAVINKKLEDYSFTISHDLKEPIRSIRSFSEVLKEDYSSLFDDEAMGYFNRIIKASNRMSRMIDDLLDLSRIGREKIEFQYFPVAEIIADVVDNLPGTTQEKIFEIKVGDIPSVKCQHVLMGRLFSNLISNSIKFGDKEKTIIEISCEKKSDYFEFSVRDNGQGIEEKHREKIFGLFRKAHQNRALDGSGVGLTIVDSIVFQHKGKVWVSWSEPGKGAEIRFTISRYL